MIISISGAQGTGKTSIIQELAHRGYSVITPSISHIAAEKQFPTEYAKEQFIVDLAEQQTATAQASPGPVYLDRSAIDIQSFMQTAKLLTPQEARSFDARLDRLMSLLQYVFVPPIGAFGIANNGIRSQDTGFQADWHKNLMQVIQQHYIPYTILHGSVQERTDQIEAMLPSMLNGL